MFYKQPQHAIEAIRQTAALYPNIDALIDRNDYIRWQKKLTTSTDFEKDITEGETFNLLNLLSTVHIENAHPSLSKLGTPIIMNLEGWLSCFPQLLKNDVFKGKVKNLNRDSFLSTLSELLVAAELQRLGYTLKFDYKFNLSKGGNRDVDLTITNSQNVNIHIEVYSPSIPAHNGFFDFDDEDVPFSKKVVFKMDDKFGDGEVLGLNGKVLMAVDIKKIDGFDIRKVFTGQNNDQLYSNMAGYLAPAVDGFLFSGRYCCPTEFCFRKN